MNESGSLSQGTAATRLPAGVVTFLLSDVEGSTRLWEGDEEEMGAAIARHYQLLDAAITLHGGVRPVEQGEGDSVVGAFARPSDAIAAALAAQRAFAEEPWPGDRRLRIRIALHTGETQLRGTDYYVGRTVIRCARLRAIAHGGQTLVSSATRDLVADRLPDGAMLCDLGSHRLKDLGAPERVWQLCHPELLEEFPPPRSLDAVANNLPIQLTSFVGREDELTELRDVLSSARQVTLTGSGGCGKTRLAVHAVAEVAERFRDGVWWVDLAPLAEPALVAPVVARTFGLREEESRPIIDSLCDRLRGSEALVALDNCEHVVDAAAELVECLLRSAPGVRIVATSREPLGVGGEVTWRVPSLDAGSATRLFAERAAQVRPGYSPDAEEQGVIAGICQRLDGIPLAIELAAARVRMMPAARIAAALDDRFRLLTGGSRRMLARQQTLETSVAWSHDLLGPDERALLRRLSVFAGGFTLEAAEAVAKAAPLDEYGVLDLLSRLVDKSLVNVEHGVHERYRLLETIRLFAGQRLIDSGEADAVRDRHLAYYLALAEEAEPRIVWADGPSWLAKLECEHDNLRAAMDWADTSGSYEPFLRMTTALTFFFELRSHLVAGNRWFARALARDEGPSVARARALWGAAHVAFYSDNFDTFAVRAPDAAQMAEALGDDWALARALNINGLATALTDPVQAREMLHRSIELGRGQSDHWAVVDGLKMLTVTWLAADDYTGLAADLAEFRAEANRLGNLFFVAWHECTIGWAGTFTGRFDEARRALHTALDLDAQLGGTATAGFATAFLGHLESLTGHHEQALARLNPFLEWASATGDGLGAPYGIPALARIRVGCGAPSEGRCLLEPMLEMFEFIPWLHAWAMNVIGISFLVEDDLPQAEASFHRARADADSIRNPRLQADATHNLAEVLSRREERGQAEDLLHQALTLRVRAGILPGIIDSLEALATLAVQAESLVEATRLFGAAAAARQSIGFTRWPVDVPRYEMNIAAATETLGPNGFESAWAEGHALSIEGAVAYAARARGERKRPSSGWASLTPTELEVVKLVSHGMTNPEVAAKLFIGPGTVKTHLKRVFSKLDISSRAELAAEATRRGAT